MMKKQQMKTELQLYLGPCYQLGSRYYSKMKEYHALVFALIDIISFLHSRYQTVVFDRISIEECEEMIDDILCGNYQLSPILVNHIEEGVNTNLFVREKWL